MTTGTMAVDFEESVKSYENYTGFLINFTG